MRLVINVLLAIFVCSDTLIFFKTINPSLYFAVLCQLLLLSLVVFLSRLKGLGSRNVILYICVFFVNSFDTIYNCWSGLS